MLSSLNWDTAISRDRPLPLASKLLRRLVNAAAAFLFALAALLLWRRAAGAIREPLSMPGLVFTGLFLALVAGIAHSAGRRFPAAKKTALLSEIALSLALLAVAATLTMPGASAAGLSLFWSILLVEEGWAWRTRLMRRTGFRPVEPSYPVGNLPRAAAAPALPLPVKKSEIAETIPPEEVTQQLTRSTAAGGAEELAGWLRVPFAACQRSGSVHLAFCPPFAHTPELTVEQIGGPGARIKTAQVLPYGARLDLKLHAAEEMPAGVVLRFSARVEGRESP